MVVLVPLFTACNSGPAAPPAKLWPVRDFVEKHDAGVDFGGWAPGELVRFEGESIPFRKDATQTGGPGLTWFPAVADGEVATYVVTEIWANHPQPWVEPVWAPYDENFERADDVWNVFPVDVGSTFYTPFWKAELLITPGLTAETYRDSRDVLNAKGIERRPGPYLVCPFVTEGMGFADDGTGWKDPLTLQPVTLGSGLRRGWVDGKEVSYYDFGPRIQGEGDMVRSKDFYVFVARAGDKPLPLAAVLPTEPLLNALVNRVDVVLPEGSGVFVPSNRDDLRAMVEARGVSVPVVAPTLDVHAAYALRVATNPACFDAVDFPTSCDWLDSPSRLLQLTPDQRIARPVQLTLGVAIPGATP